MTKNLVGRYCADHLRDLRDSTRVSLPCGARCLALACSMLGLAAPVTAQNTSPGGIAPPSRSERPYRGLFGSGVGTTAQSLTFEGSLGGGFVENPLVEQRGAALPQGAAVASRGTSGVGSGTLTYTMDRTRFGLNATHLSLVDYYPGLDQHSMLPRHIISGVAYFMPAASTRISFIQSFKNLPEFSFSDLFDSEIQQALPVRQDIRLAVDRYRRFGSGVEVSHRLSKRSRIEGDLNYAHGKVASREWIILKGSGTFTHNINKGIALFVGYEEGGQRDKTLGVQRPHERQPRIKGGVDYNRALSFSRRTTVSFSTGLAGTQDRQLNQTDYHLVGSAHINREFGQTWTAGLSYNRNVRQIEPLGEPVFGDSIAFIVQGSFSQRVQFQSYLGGSNGHFGSTGNGYQSRFGSVQISMALTRLVALGTDYVYSSHSVSGETSPLESLGAMKTQSLRTYLQVWVPLLTRTKR
jgi:hypothetical protein